MMTADCNGPDKDEGKPQQDWNDIGDGDHEEGVALSALLKVLQGMADSLVTVDGQNQDTKLRHVRQ